eukprot:CAMPEP_0206005658 /NCGR_PEP_ID=MMETSP1464-20131121/4714_1 /ASSEMBLY_ACC=CAM_ASM_001124 /TAXON_ID=119497 /ORGANISM="Exanthemachrysis gayraliae, Strain RCC1523" /LENGTH=126 /DNA_ID=CAMNT_0053379109 /DNA_START=59 /DNA_END=436 /DNA_ORIENTATION=-
MSGGNGSELACVYAALALHDDGVEITADKIAALLKAANVEVEPYWPSLFAKLCQGKDLGTMISSIGSGVAGGGKRRVLADRAAAAARGVGRWRVGHGARREQNVTGHGIPSLRYVRAAPAAPAAGG